MYASVNIHHKHKASIKSVCFIWQLMNHWISETSHWNLLEDMLKKKKLYIWHTNYMSSITNNAMGHKYGVISLKLNIVKICTNGKYALNNVITKFTVLSNFLDWKIWKKVADFVWGSITYKHYKCFCINPCIYTVLNNIYNTQYMFSHFYFPCLQKYGKCVSLEENKSWFFNNIQVKMLINLSNSCESLKMVVTFFSCGVVHTLHCAYGRKHFFSISISVSFCSPRTWNITLTFTNSMKPKE